LLIASNRPAGIAAVRSTESFGSMITHPAATRVIRSIIAAGVPASRSCSGRLSDSGRGLVIFQP
jgi:hypothetical protein